jgi:hypothetical protein
MPLQCQACGAPVGIGEPIPRDSECASCGHDLRCCTNCRHYDVRMNNACRETMAEPVEDKHRRNFCEYFSFNPAPRAAAGAGQARQAESRARLEKLFGGTGAPAPGTPSAREKLESMFGPKPASERKDDARRKLDDLFRRTEPAEPGEAEDER